MKKLFRSITFVILLVITPFANAYNTYHPQQREYESNPVHYIQAALEKLEAFSRNINTASPVVLRNFIEHEIIPYFSFDEMSRWITGPYARHMTREEKADFQQRLKQAFLNSLSKHLNSFGSIKNRVRFHRTKYRGRYEAIVGAQVYRTNNYPVRLDFHMRKIGPDWKIVDVRANGISAVFYYRQLFIADLRQYRRR